MNTNTDQVSKLTYKTVDNTMRDIALALRDVIQDTPDEGDPEEAYHDLACRLVLKLARNDLTIVPAIRHQQTEAAWRCLDIFTRLLQANPECSYITSVEPEGKFEIYASTDGKTPSMYCQGASVQDAYAQAAQAIAFNGGTL